VVKINFDAIEKTKSKENDEKGARFAGRGRGVEVKMRMVCGVIYSGMIQRLEWWVMQPFEKEMIKESNAKDLIIAKHIR